MKKRLFVFTLILCMLITPLTGCQEKEPEWLSEAEWIEVENSGANDSNDKTQSDANNSNSDASGGNKSNTSSSSQSGGKTTSSKGSQGGNNNNKRPTKQPTGNNAIVTKYTGKDPNANYKVSGKVTVAVNTNRPTDYEAMFDAFASVYKNVDLEIVYYANSDNALDWVLKQASVNKLPDVVFDDAASVPTYVAQGLLYPLDKYVKNDPDIKYVSTNILDTYKYGGKLFALPNSIHFSCVMINKDIVNKLNLKMPSLSWTVDDMVSFLKAGTTDTYSGCEQLFGNYTLAAQLCPIYDSSVGLYGYDHKNGKFKLSSMTKGLNLTAELRKYPGLEAFSLRSTNKYTAKFGNSNTSDSRMALKLGKTLVEFDSGTWEEPNLTNYKFKTVLWPYPQSTKGSMPIHVDHSMMMKNAKNPDAAYQLLRFITYSTEGNLVRLSMYDNANKDKYVLSSKFYFPVTSHPDVKAKFNSLKVSQEFQYMYDNISKCYRADIRKYMPDYKNVMATATEEWNKVMDGLKDANSVNSTMEGKLNSKLKESLDDFNAKIAKHYK